jgi:hypothetical protein
MIRNAKPGDLIGSKYFPYFKAIILEVETDKDLRKKLFKCCVLSEGNRIKYEYNSPAIQRLKKLLDNQ